MCFHPKLLRERNGAKKLELEGKATTAQQKVIEL